MKFAETSLSGVFLINPTVFEDERGFFMESFTAKEMQEHDLPIKFVQDNHALSKIKGVLRGLHFQKFPYFQSKLVRVTRGAVYDVVVDIRKSSNTFGRWFGTALSEENKTMLFVPKGFAHGYVTLTDETEFLYKVDSYYAPDFDAGIKWNDPDLKINWPIDEPMLSKKDAMLPFLKDI